MEEYVLYFSSNQGSILFNDFPQNLSITSLKTCQWLSSKLVNDFLQNIVLPNHRANKLPIRAIDIPCLFIF